MKACLQLTTEVHSREESTYYLMIQQNEKSTQNILYKYGIEHKRLDTFSHIVTAVLLTTHGATVIPAHL